MNVISAPLALLGPIGPMEFGIILFIVILLFGAKKLPQLARSMGKSMGEFKRGRQEFENELKRAGEESDEVVGAEDGAPKADEDAKAG
jgi:sec-independent protein translocase protein TatA